MPNCSWTAPIDRRSWHEAGHLLVAMTRSGVAHGVALLPNGDAKTIPDPNVRHPAPTTDSDWLDIVAWTVAGRVAVKWAIENGDLDAAPTGVEGDHGEHGYCGGVGTDEAHANTYAANVRSMSAAEALVEGERRALETITNNNQKLRDLCVAIFYSGALSSNQVRKVLT